MAHAAGSSFCASPLRVVPHIRLAAHRCQLASELLSRSVGAGRNGRGEAGCLRTQRCRLIRLTRTRLSPLGRTLVRAASDQESKDVAPDLPSVQEPAVSNAPVESCSKLSYSFITGLGAVGLLETVYLTWSKLSGGSVVCPLGAAACADVLDSEYASIYGVPLSLLGVAAYGAVSVLGFWGLKNREGQDSLQKWLLLGCTSAMAVASAYFMYILTSKLEGASCTYCVSSALLSLSLLLATLRGFPSVEIQKVLGLQAAVGASVVVALSVGFSDANVAAAASVDLPFVQYEVVTSSTPEEVSLAKHLRSIGAKMYGAFWCSHCLEQKEMFGQEALKYLDYVECYPDGYRKGVPIAKACEGVKIEGFPTWVINGEVVAGELELPELAQRSGFDSINVSQ